MPIGELDQRAPDGRRIYRTRRVVRIDDDEHARACADEASQMIEIGEPVAIGIGAVVARLRGNLGEDGRVQRVRRRRHEHFIAFVNERIERQLDPFGRAGRNEHAVG